MMDYSLKARITLEKEENFSTLSYIILLTKMVFQKLELTIQPSDEHSKVKQKTKTKKSPKTQEFLFSLA